jgi:hypothetical protein
MKQLLFQLHLITSSAMVVAMTNPEKPSSNSEGGIGCLFLFGLLAWGLYAGWTAVRDHGYIRRSEAVNLYMSADWLQNESRQCQGVQEHPEGKSPQMDAIFCPEDLVAKDTFPTPHHIEIHFFGKTSRPDSTFVDETYHLKFEWRCERKSEAFEGESFSCYAID